MSTKRRTMGVWSTPRPLGPNGEKLCYNCHGALPKGKRYNCSKKCSEHWMLRTSPSFVRFKVWERDKGVCAGCGSDTVKTAPPHRNGTSRRNSPRGTGDLWQADHIKPVIEGGGECDLSNFRTLCIPCHKKVTKELHGRLKRKRIEARPLPLLDQVDA